MSTVPDFTHTRDVVTLRCARGGVTLLLVDDDPLVRLLLRTTLNQAGYAVIDAPDGQSAILIASRMRFDMLVTDFQMPEIDGLELAKRLSEAVPSLPVLMLSGALPDLLPLENIRQHCWSFLPKPVDPRELMSIIDSHCL